MSVHTKSDAKNFIEQAFGPADSASQGMDACVKCPRCEEKGLLKDGKRKLCIRTDNWLTHCWVCGYKNKSILWLLKEFRPDLVNSYVEKFADSILLSLDSTEDLLQDHIKLPDGFTMLGPLVKASKRTRAQTRAIRYLFDRGLTEKDIWVLAAGITEEDPVYAHRVILPSFDGEGDVNFFTARSVIPGWRPPYLNPKFDGKTTIFGEWKVNWEKEVVLVEGVFDSSNTENSIPLLGKEVFPDWKLFSKLRENDSPIVIFLDRDAADVAMNMARRFFEADMRVRVVDSGQLPIETKDPGSLNKKTVASLVKSAKVYDSEYDILARINSIGTKKRTQIIEPHAHRPTF